MDVLLGQNPKLPQFCCYSNHELNSISYELLKLLNYRDPEFLTEFSLHAPCTSADDPDPVLHLQLDKSPCQAGGWSTGSKNPRICQE